MTSIFNVSKPAAQSAAGLLFKMADALCLSYSESNTAAQALIQAKRLYDVNFDTTVGPRTTKTLDINIGAFASAIFICNDIPYESSVYNSAGIIIPILPNMGRRGFPIYKNSTIISSYIVTSLQSYYAYGSMSSTANQVTFYIEQGPDYGMDDDRWRLNGVIAVLS